MPGTTAQALPHSEPAAPLVTVFACVGALALAICVWTAVAWIASPDFKPSPVGGDKIPAMTLVAIHGFEVALVVGGIAFTWFKLIKPLIRDRRLSWDGTLMLALLTMWVQDPIVNYFNYSFMYNAYFLNMGSWTMSIPGWQSPRQGNLPEPLLYMGGIYLWVTLLNVVVFCWVIGKLRKRYPHRSLIGHLPIALLVLIGIDLATDVPGPWFGVYAYAAATRIGTLWAGTPQQLPVYTVVFMSLHYMNLGLLRLNRDDRGESWAERGLSRLKIPERSRTLMRYLALVGYCHLSYFFIYMMPYNWFALQAQTMPAYPSYMRVEICGRGTPYACPSREVPIPSRRSLAIAPDDPRLPPAAREN